jgi:hypothetical protein
MPPDKKMLQLTSLVEWQIIRWQCTYTSVKNTTRYRKRARPFADQIDVEVDSYIRTFKGKDAKDNK